MKPAIGVATAYAALLLPLLGVLPLWLDEVLELIGTRGRSLEDIIYWVPANPGAVPFGYLTEAVALNVLGYSVWAARLPAAVFSVASVVAIAALARRLGEERPWLAALALAALPLPLRYGLEARVYSQALFFSILSTLAFVTLCEKPGWNRAAAYGACVLAGLYTQLYTAFVVAGHLAVLPRRAALHVLAAAGAAGVLFLPWLDFAHGTWTAASVASGYAFAFRPAMLFRELSGGGWSCSLLLLGAAVAGLANPRRRLLLAIVAAPVAGALVADAIFGYFFAIRQVLFALPGLVILAAHRRAPALALVAVSLGADVWRFFKPHEDWALAARTLRAAGDCVLVAPKESTVLYTFFEPLRTCNGGERRVALAVTPYTPREAESRAIADLRAAGYTAEKTRAAGGSKIILFSLPESGSPGGRTERR